MTRGLQAPPAQEAQGLLGDRPRLRVGPSFPGEPSSPTHLLPLTAPPLLFLTLVFVVRLTAGLPGAALAAALAVRLALGLGVCGGTASGSPPCARASWVRGSCPGLACKAATPVPDATRTNWGTGGPTGTETCLRGLQSLRWVSTQAGTRRCTPPWIHDHITCTHAHTHTRVRSSTGPRSPSHHCPRTLWGPTLPQSPSRRVSLFPFSSHDLNTWSTQVPGGGAGGKAVKSWLGRGLATLF